MTRSVATRSIAAMTLAAFVSASCHGPKTVSAPGKQLGAPSPISDQVLVQSKDLPPGLEVETFDGSAWVGLVPFAMRVTLPRSPLVPWLSRFPETNVRTYARSADGNTV